MKYIYLDSNFWIDLGDGIRNRFPNNDIKNFYYLLKELVYSGKAICPISNAIFIELFKQKIIGERQAIAKVMDEFSKGFTIQSKFFLFKDEIFNFSKKILPNPWKDVSEFRTVSEEVITNTPKWKSNFSSQKFPPSLFQLSAFEIVGSIEKHKNSSSNIADYLQKQKEEHDSEARDFDMLQAVEILNTISSVFKIFPELKKQVSGFDISEIGPELHLKMPAIWAIASIHSLLRNDPNRKYRTNDFFDIEHCSIALGYYDYFFTERSFFNIVTHKLAELDKRFSLVCARKYDHANNLLLDLVNSA